MGLERKSLLLRQVAALRRHGMAHGQALAHAADGLPAGELQAVARWSLRQLEEGGEAASTDDPTAALLANGDCSVQQLEHGASALEARLWAQSSLQSARLYFGLALAGPPLLACLMAWLSLPLLAALQIDDGLLVVLGFALRWGGVPLAVVALVLVKRLHRGAAPGYRQAMLATALLEQSVRGVEPSSLSLSPNQERYLAARRAVVGADVAARELAAELCAQSERTQALFAQLAPLLGAAVLLPMVVVGFGVLVFPLSALFQVAGNY